MKYGMYIGRFQPLHLGHIKLFETELKQGNNILIALRDTEISEKNPYTIEQRKKMIHKAMKEWKGRYKIIKIPDIYGVFYGRKVGYEIKKITLPPEIENISATKIRNEKYGL